MINKAFSAPGTEAACVKSPRPDFCRSLSPRSTWASLKLEGAVVRESRGEGWCCTWAFGPLIMIVPGILDGGLAGLIWVIVPRFPAFSHCTDGVIVLWAVSWSASQVIGIDTAKVRLRHRPDLGLRVRRPSGCHCGAKRAVMLPMNFVDRIAAFDSGCFFWVLSNLNLSGVSYL